MKPRILIAGHEIGGQMSLLANSLRQRGFLAHSAAFNSDFRKYKNDFQIQGQKIPYDRFRFFLKAIQEYDVFHFFWGISLLDFWRFTGLDLPFLKARKKKIIVHFRGTDLINIRYYSYLINKTKGEDAVAPSQSRPDQLARLNQWRKYADHLLVSTPDLMEIVPEAILVPQVVDVDELSKFIHPIKNKIFRLGHAPTRRNTKGTDFIIQAVNQLCSEGYDIELDLIEKVTPDEVIRRFSNCDAGIDQLLNGWYGKVSVELMAMGKPVLCYIDERYQSIYPDLPIVNVNHKNLKSELSKLLLIRSHNIESTLSFVRSHHDVSLITNRMLDLYCS